LPAVLGASTITNALHHYIEMAGHALGRNAPVTQKGGIDTVVQAWPEYVIGPDHPFSFLGPGMDCTMFAC